MKLWLLSDLHFGKYSNSSDKWLKLMEDYFNEWFIPLLKKYKKPTDKLIILGDIFDNRNSINVKCLNTVINIFEELSKIIEIHILIGNHDMYLMNDRNINSVASIRNIDNIYVYDEPTIVDFDGCKTLLMPWVNAKNNEKDILEQYKGQDLLLCHSDLNGCRTQLYPTRPHSRHILDIDDFNGYKRVFSGHIHIVQTIKNFTFVGSPYHLDRNDISNRKGVFIYDTIKKTDFFFENDYSSEFEKCTINSAIDFDKLKSMLKTNNFIDVYISNKLLSEQPHLRLELDKLNNKHNIEQIHFIDDIVREKKIKINTDKSIEELSIDWVNKLDIDHDNKDILKDEMYKIVKKVIKLNNSK